MGKEIAKDVRVPPLSRCRALLYVPFYMVDPLIPTREGFDAALETTPINSSRK